MTGKFRCPACSTRTAPNRGSLCRPCVARDLPDPAPDEAGQRNTPPSNIPRHTPDPDVWTGRMPGDPLPEDGDPR